jgi:hypothetical protein
MSDWLMVQKFIWIRDITFRLVLNYCMWVSRMFLLAFGSFVLVSFLYLDHFIAEKCSSYLVGFIFTYINLWSYFPHLIWIYFHCFASWISRLLSLLLFRVVHPPKYPQMFEVLKCLRSITTSTMYMFEVYVPFYSHSHRKNMWHPLIYT